MITWKWLKGELAVAEHLIAGGNGGKALERLKYLLDQYDPEDAMFDLHRANILHAMGKAAASIHELETAEDYYFEAIEILGETEDVAAGEQADFYMSLAEHFATRRLHKESMHFADVSLECITLDSNSFGREESAELLRRYAWVAERSGAFPAAYLALSIGMLVLHEVNGMESEVAASLADMTHRVCSVESPKAIQQVGKCMINQLRYNDPERLVQ